MTMSKLLKRTRKCCLKIFQRLSISSPNDGGDYCDKATSGRGRSGGHLPGGGVGPTKLVNRLARNQVSYTQHRNGTPTRTPTRHHRVIPTSGHSPEINQHSFSRGFRSEDNSTTFDELSIEEPGFRVNLYGSSSVDSYEDFDRLPGYYVTNGSDKSRDRISGNGSSSRSADNIDQWPSQIDEDTAHPVIFVENRVYVGPNDKDEFKCYDLGGGATAAADQRQPRRRSNQLPSSPGGGKQNNKKKVLFEKVNYERYKQAKTGEQKSPRNRMNGTPTNSPWRYVDDDPEWQQQHRRQNHYFSDCEIDRHEYGQKWCEDLLNWSRGAADYQPSSSAAVADGCSSSSCSWFQEKFRSASGSRYNKMNSTDDSGVVCHFEDNLDEEQSYWTNHGGGDDKEEYSNDSRVNANQSGQGLRSDSPSWEELKQRVFEPAERTSSKAATSKTKNEEFRDSEGRLLGRRCSCNSMCTSLCTLETWLDDDEIFDNSFNEELERRCGIITN